ncbi:MAG: DUF4258 domain-containing protein [Gemmatimonadales bacterium]
MARGILARIRTAVADGAYDISAHALDEMADDNLEVWDLEAAVLTGHVHERQRDDPRGVRYVLRGWAADRDTPVGVVCRFTDTGRLLIITVYRMTPPDDA